MEVYTNVCRRPSLFETALDLFYMYSYACTSGTILIRRLATNSLDFVLLS